MDISINKGINVIEASAGTGKTFQLSFLFIRLHLQKKIPLKNLCAITFTNLATAELRGRIRLLFKEIRDYLYYKNIANPTDEKLAPNIREWLDKTFASKEYTQIIKECDLALLYIHHAKISTIHSFFQELLQRYYLQADIASNFEVITENSYWQDLMALWAREFWLKQIHSNKASYKEIFQKLFPNPDELLKFLSHNSLGRAISTDMQDLNWQEIWELLSTKRARGKPAQEKKCLHYFKNLFLQVVNAKTDSLVQNGKLSYNLIIERMVTASKNRAFCENVNQEIKALLVDEFQDTDYLQWNAIQNLFIKKQTKEQQPFIYLIGDPKQSIYRFRSADIECYFSAVKESETKQNLLLNWRSDKQLIDALNAIYSQSQLTPTPFEHPDLNYQLVNVPENKGAEESSLQFVQGNEETLQKKAIVLRANDSERMRKPACDEQMAKWVLQDCLQLCTLIQQKKAHLKQTNSQAPLDYSDILILCRTNAAILKIAYLLENHDIPTSREIKVKLWETNEAGRVISLLQNLKTYSQDNKPSSLEAILFTLGYPAFSCEKTKQTTIDKIKNIIDDWQNFSYYQGPLYLWKKILAERCYGTFHLPKNQLKKYLEQITQLFEKLQSWWVTGELSIDSWLHKIQMSSEPSELKNTQEGGIRLMTVHHAKGSEAAIVICPDLWNIGGDKTDHFTDYLSYTPTRQHYVLTEEANTEAKKIENHRLLYVALTRAKSKLLLYWLPYQQRKGVVNTFESLLFHTQYEAENKELNDDNEANSLHGLSEIPNMWLLRENEHLLKTIDFSYKKIKAEKEHIEKKLPEHKQLKAFNQTQYGLWSFTRFNQYNNHQDDQPLEYEKDVEEQGEKISHTQTFSNLLSGTRLGTLVHQLIQTILENPPTTEEHLSIYINDEVSKLLSNTRLPKQEKANAIELISSLSKATLKTTLASSQQGSEYYPLFSPFWHKFCEIRFDIQVTHWQIEKLNHISQKYPELPLPSLNKLSIKNTLFNGFIDLVLVPIECGKNIWIVDFKTNFLGEHIEDYSYEKMHQAMLDHHYGWQAVFYALAVYKWSKATSNKEQIPSEIRIAYLFSRGLKLATDEQSYSDAGNVGKYFLTIPELALNEIAQILQ
jgi:exodeoxyribonuclease V beta subunit